MNPEEFRAEAERLALVDRQTQQLHIAMLREIVANTKVPKRDRALAKDRADALEKHLKRIKREGVTNT
jgi:hypothetical protein